ncbi:MAG: polyprenyl synthetase family protein [Oscillospiraceae bacterium]|nr:polyprenyl synthetase family protein [Oscillospiraceae bacterium]MDD3832610.1 polyprenyl synthetase family protein [Oscillospiraceae bacterium]MDD4546726.1 polyprenyl synthetase family protein [Oscillospiraceae bacterium]
MINETSNNNDFVSYDKGVAMVKEQLDKTLLSVPPVVRSQAEHLAGSKGKFIRASALLACSQNDDGLIHPDAVKMAVSVELLHLATLVHDDVIDNADMRRGMPTLQKKFGKHPAVISGDYLFCLALKVASGATRKQEYLEFELPDYMGRVCLGELMQGINNKNYELSIYRYLYIISGKTAALFEASFYAGAMLCGTSKKEAGLYSRLGHYVGMIFQLVDDCIDYESSQKDAKKPVLSDYEQGVITLPLIYTLKKNPKIKKLAKAGELTKSQAVAAVNQAQGVEYTRMISKRYYDKAKIIIDNLGLHSNKKVRLTALLDKAYTGLG